MTLIKTANEIEILKQGGKILGRVLGLLVKQVKPGISTAELDLLAREEILKSGATPSFPGYKIASDTIPFPAALCTSIDDEVVHCIPNQNRILKSGQVIGLDLGVKFQGLYTDAAVTVPVGKVDAQAENLIATTRQALANGIAQVKPGKTIGDIANAIETTAKKAGLAVIRDLVGHGVGHAIHERPIVPNYGRAGSLEKLEQGMVLAIEPMFNLGSHLIKFLPDGWSVVTADGSLSAHFEHTIVVTSSGCEVLTTADE